MTPSESQSDRIDELIIATLEDPPASLQQRLREIPDLAAEPVPVMSRLEFLLNALATGILYLWAGGMIWIFRSSILNSLEKLWGLLERIFPNMTFGTTQPWVSLGVLVVLSLLVLGKLLNGSRTIPVYQR